MCFTVAVGLVLHIYTVYESITRGFNLIVNYLSLKRMEMAQPEEKLFKRR